MQVDAANSGEVCKSVSLSEAAAPYDGSLDIADDRCAVLDRILSGLVAKGHVLEALALYLRLSISEVLARVARLGLPTPSCLPMRPPRGKRPWSVEEVSLLIERWATNWHVACIAEETGRTPGAVRSKARRLGLYRRERRDLVRVGRADSVASGVHAAEDSIATSPVSETVDETVPEGAANPTEMPAETGEQAPRKVVEKKRSRIQWNDDLDMKVAKRWFAWQCRFGIAKDLGISPAAIRTRATRMGLPPRDRKKIVPDYVEGRPYDRSLEESRVKRRCQQGNMTFWGKRDGPHTSPKIMQTKGYKDLRRGVAEAVLHL
jgi:hypothetical protein